MRGLHVGMEHQRRKQLSQLLKTQSSIAATLLAGMGDYGEMR